MERVYTREMRSPGPSTEGLMCLCNFIKNIFNYSELEMRLSERTFNYSHLQIVEIGTYCGSGSKILANAFLGATIYCVDPWDNYIDTVDSSIGRGNPQQQLLELQEAEKLFDNVVEQYKNIIKNKTTSVEFSKTVSDNSIDLVYIDGNHEYEAVKQDLNTWYSKVKTNSIIAGHDWSLKSINSALYEFFKKPPLKTFNDDSWLYIK